jgi:sugar lactone lactonase YvrE
MTLSAQDEVIDFESELWVKVDAEVVEHMGRKSLMGIAYLKDVEFENGIIEVDIAVNGMRSYPGINFRIQSLQDYERFYIRPHRSPLYPDALQYMPVVNGVGCWQLYNGEGYTAGTSIPLNQWIHLKMEISGKQARVYLGDTKKPALVINDLKHGVSKGAIGLYGPKDKTAFFSNFKYRIDDTLKFDSPPKIETPPGIIMEWQLSQVFKASQIDTEHYPSQEELAKVTWQKVGIEPSGLVNVARFVKFSRTEPESVLAKTTLLSDKDEVKKFWFGYSDEISIFLNGKILFTGNSAYRSRDPSFLGIIGLYDAIYLPLKKGENELLLLITESFGGWGFMFQDGTAIFHHQSVKKAWNTTKAFMIPESTVYDPVREVIYVSNYDGYHRSRKEGKQFISKVAMNGKIEKLKWAEGLFNPTGLAIFQDKLYAAEIRSLVEIDIESGQIVNRYPAPGSIFLNDIAVDESGNIYISDSAKHMIYRFADGQFEEWLKGDEIRNPNGLHVYKNQLIVGNNGDNCLKSVNLTDKRIDIIVKLGPGIIDGVKSDKEGNFLVSHWQGKLYRVTQEGKITKLLDTTAPEINEADFEYVLEKNLIIIPTFFNNRVIAYQIKE